MDGWGLWGVSFHFGFIVASLQERRQSEGRAKAERRQGGDIFVDSDKEGKSEFVVLDTIIKNIWRYKVKTELKGFVL